MNIITTMFQYYLEFSSNAYAVIPVQVISFVILAKIIINFINLKVSQRKFNYEKILFIFFLIPIVAIMLDNIVLISKFIIPKTPLYRSINCLAWMFSGIKFYSLILFLEQLIHKKINWNWYHKLFCLLEFLLCCSFVISTIHAIRYNESYQFVIIFYYAVALFSFVSIVFAIVKQLSNKHLPIVLKKQLKTLLFYFLCPHFICILLELMPIVFFNTHRIVAFSNLGTILITASIYFCFKKMMQFRFLNLSDHVQTEPNLHAVTDFKEAIEQINIASSEQELSYITQQFCTEQLGINKNQVTLYIRSSNVTTDQIQENIEKFLSTDLPSFNRIDVLIKHKILVSHEIEFDEFYTDNTIIVSLAQFLRSINADIFVPIINNKKLLGYIIVSHNDRKVLYSVDLQNKMMVFAQFLAPAMYMMQQQNTYHLLQETKEIKEDLYAKHQEIQQYKESIKQLLKDRLEHHIGIVFCKGRLFNFKNQEAHNLLTINPNLEPEHPTSLALINFAQQIEKFQTAQTMYLPITDGSKLMISGMPQAHMYGGVLLIVRKPEATDLIRMHIDSLQNPSHRDYLLYLETTKAGQTINHLLPSNHETFLNIKIQLLQSALQNSPLLLEMHQDDIDTATDMIHQLSARAMMHTLTLQTEQDQRDQAIKIFGINPLLQTSAEQPLLEKLVGGTLVIKNIEHLSTITQQKLAHLMRYGIFTPIKSEQRKFSDTRIICTTTQNLVDLYRDGIIIAELYTELQKHYVQLPSLVTMSDAHITQLIDGFMYQNMQQNKDQTLRALNYKDKQAIIEKRIASLFMLQQKVRTFMSIKEDQISILPHTQTKLHTQALHGSCPEIQLAAQLGKHALKDIQLMKTLWKQLGNQTKIADLLGVNRSSVNRRCKEYNLV